MDVQSRLVAARRNLGLLRHSLLPLYSVNASLASISSKMLSLGGMLGLRCLESLNASDRTLRAYGILQRVDPYSSSFSIVLYRYRTSIASHRHDHPSPLPPHTALAVPRPVRGALRACTIPWDRSVGPVSSSKTKFNITLRRTPSKTL